MGIWYFWERYYQAIDNLPTCEVQIKLPPDQLDRGAELKRDAKVSRFLFAIKRMPKAWSSKPWTTRQMNQANSNVANDLFRRKLRRDFR